MDRNTRLLLPLALCCSLTLGLAQLNNAQAAATSKAGSDKPAPGTAGNTTSASDAAAQVVTLKQEQQQLRRMGEPVKRVLRAGLDLIGECTQPVEMMGEIDIIGQDVIPIMPATSEGFDTQYNPPRPKYINLHMAQLGSLIPILQDEIKNLVIPPSEKDYAAQPLADINGNMDDLLRHYGKLLELTKTDDYDQVLLTNEARGIDSCVRDIDKARKKLLHEDEKVERKEEKLEKGQNK